MTPTNRLLNLQMQEDTPRFGQHKRRPQWGYEEKDEVRGFNVFVCEPHLEIVGTPSMAEMVLGQLSDRSFELVRIGALEARAFVFSGMQVELSEPGLDQATVASIKQMTEEIFGSAVGTRWVEDPGETPYWTFVAKVAHDADSEKIVELHSTWHKTLVLLAPDAIGKVSLNLSCE
jgi:hypothetical protein